MQEMICLDCLERVYLILNTFARTTTNDFEILQDLSQ